MIGVSGRFGSLHNLIADSSAQPEPVPGMGATELMWSDRHAYTVVEVVRFTTGPKKGSVKAVVAQRDIARRCDSNGMSESQVYEFTRNPYAAHEVWSLRKDGRFVSHASGSSLVLGHRSEYYDYSF